MGFARVSDAARYALANARAPAALVIGGDARALPDDLVALDILIEDGRIAAILPPGKAPAGLPALDLDRSLVFPGFVDIHTHLDKGHIWPRAENPDGTFAGALAATQADREANWSPADVEARMEFALACAHAHGTVAMRTHLDSIGKQTGITWPVFERVRDRWAGRIALQAVPLFPIDLALDEAHLRTVLDAVARAGSGLLGAVTYMGEALAPGLDRLFHLAKDHDLALDFHVDETQDPAAASLRAIAEAALRHRFEGSILCGHCCSLARQPEDEADRTMDLVAETGIAVVALPLCNLYLQDRVSGRTPRARGITCLHELAARGVKVMLASDNTRDPFYAYGDNDMLEVLRAGLRIGHLDRPVGRWPAAVAAAPATHMGIAAGRIAKGATADLILFRGRTWTELLSRPESDRTVLRAGRPVERTLPDYRELDALMEVAT